MGWWMVVKVIAYIACVFISRARTQRPGDAQPKGVSDFQLPTNDPTRVIPVVFGRCKITGPCILWYGDFAVTPIRKDETIIKYYYQLGFDLGVCHGPVTVRDVLFNDTSGNLTLIENRSGVLVYETEGAAVSMAGSSSQSEGRHGVILVYPGSASQITDPYMAARVGATYPNYPGLCHLVLRFFTELEIPGMTSSQMGGTGFCLGTTESIESVAVDVERFPNTLQLPSNHHMIEAVGDYDANPACMLHEILTNTTWGLGLPASAIDLASFTAAGETLYYERFGLSMLLEQASEASGVVADILRHIDGDLYSDPVTGQLVLKLVRADYDPDTLLVLDESCVRSIEFTRQLETVNQVRVEYTNRASNYTPQSEMAFDSGSFNRTGQNDMIQASYRGISCARNAAVVAGRILLSEIRPFATLKLTVDRSAWRLRPTGVFKLNWPDYGIAGMICRVTRPAGGTLTDGTVTIDCLEDTFGFTATDYVEPPGEEWTDPIGPPTAVVGNVLIELPYQLAPESGRIVAALAARSNPGQIGFLIYRDMAGGSAYVESVRRGHALGFYASGTLHVAYPADTSADDATGFEIESPLDCDLLTEPTEDQLWHGLSLAMIDDEIVGWRTIAFTGETRQIGGILRGLLDTVPAAHAHGARVWFIAPGPDSRLNPGAGMLADGTVAAKLVSVTTRLRLNLADAERTTLTTASRALKPLPPGKVRLNGAAWPATLVAGVDVVVTWAHRHRLNQATAGLVVSQDADDQAAAPEGNYTIEVRVGGTLRRTVTAITGTTWTWTAAMQITDSASVGSAITIQIIPVNSSLSGHIQLRGFNLA
jgi:hypothetical protein